MALFSAATRRAGTLFPPGRDYARSCRITTHHNRNHDLAKKLTPARLRIDHKQALSPGGIYRDTVVFSIINQEWPAVRQNLRYLLERGGG